MKLKALSLIILLLVVLLVGCVESYRDNGILEKSGKIIKIKYNVPFGGTFSDTRDDLYFDDGTILEHQNGDLSIVELNRTGNYKFRKNYFDYEGCRYEFHKLLSVQYLEASP